MSFRSYNPHLRYKERAVHRLANFLGFCAVLLIIFLFGFWIGRQTGGEKQIMMQKTIEGLEEQNTALRSQITEMSAKVQTSARRFEDLQKEIDGLLPEGPLQGIVDLLRSELEKGSEPQRLKYLIKSGRPPTGCTPPETKRFIIRTPLYKGSESSVEIKEAGLKINGNGAPAQNEEGQTEAWYDPSKPVTITFFYDDRSESKEGILPLRHFIVLGDREYRFTVEQGAQSFAKVIFDSCAYP